LKIIISNNHTFFKGAIKRHFAWKTEIHTPFALTHHTSFHHLSVSFVLHIGCSIQKFGAWKKKQTKKKTTQEQR